jgi:hypothetical protein
MPIKEQRVSKRKSVSRKKSAAQMKHQARAKKAMTLYKSGKVSSLKKAWTQV